MRRNKEASRRIASKRIGGPLGGPIPSPSGRIGFRDNRGDFHGRQFGQSVPAPRHTRSSFDSVRYSGELLFGMLRTSVSVVDFLFHLIPFSLIFPIVEQVIKWTNRLLKRALHIKDLMRFGTLSPAVSSCSQLCRLKFWG